METGEASDTIERNYDDDDDNNDDDVDDGDDVYTQLLETDIDFDTVELDLDGDEGEIDPSDDHDIIFETQEDSIATQESEESEDGQEQEQEQKWVQRWEREQDVEINEELKRYEEQEQEWARMCEQELAQGRGQEFRQKQWERSRALERRREDALRLANEEVNAYGPAFVDARALEDRNTVVEGFYQVRHARKLVYNVSENLNLFAKCLDERGLTLLTVEQRLLAEAICEAEAAFDLLVATGTNFKMSLDRE